MNIGYRLNGFYYSVNNTYSSLEYQESVKELNVKPLRYSFIVNHIYNESHLKPPTGQDIIIIDNHKRKLTIYINNEKYAKCLFNEKLITEIFSLIPRFVEKWGEYKVADINNKELLIDLYSDVTTSMKAISELNFIIPIENEVRYVINHTIIKHDIEIPEHELVVKVTTNGIEYYFEGKKYSFMGIEETICYCSLISPYNIKELFNKWECIHINHLFNHDSLLLELYRDVETLVFCLNSLLNSRVKKASNIA